MNSTGQSSLDVNRLVTGMIRASRLDQTFYGELRSDTSWTQDAWIVVIVVSILGAIGAFLGTLLSLHSIFGAVGQLIWQIVAGVGGFALWAFLVTWVGNSWFKGQGDFGEVQRLLGFAYSPRILSVVSFIPCIGPLIALVGAIWSLVTGYFAIKDALGQDNTNAILTIVVSFVIVIVVTAVIGTVLGLGAFVGSRL